MAKKIAVDTEDADYNGNKKGKRKKKKRSKCCTCCLYLLAINFVILIIASGVGWYFGDKLTKQHFGLSLGDTFGIVGNLYWTDDSDVVTNRFSEEDKKGFYSEIKKNVFLKDDVDDTIFDDALRQAVEKYLNSSSDNSNTSSTAPLLRAGEPTGGSTGETTGGTTGSTTGGAKESSLVDIFVNMISGVLHRDNIDVTRLNAYDENDPSTDEYIFNLNDKQLAAFLDSMLKTILEKSSSGKLKDVSKVVDLSKAAALKQVKFTARTEKDESGADIVKATNADVTIWLGLQNTANSAIKAIMGQAGIGWAAGMVGFLSDIILPENFYITMSVPLFGDGKPLISINDMNADELERTYQLLNGMVRMAGGVKTVEDVLAEYADMIKPFLEKATDKMDFSQAGTGTIKIDLLDAVTKMASDGQEGEQLGKADFIYVLKALMSDSTEQLQAIEPYRYENRYLVNNEEVYMPNGTGTAIDYEKKFISAIENAYALSFAQDASLNEVLAMLGISLDGNNSSVGSASLLDIVDAEAFNDLLNTPAGTDNSLRVTDRMLAASLSGQMNTLIAQGGDFGNLKIKLDALTFISKASKPGNTYAMLAVEVDLGDFVSGSLGSDGFAAKLAAGLMPKNILLTVIVDITEDPSRRTDETQFIINSCKDTDRAVATLEKLVPTLNLSEITGKIDTMLNDMLDKMRGTLNITLEPSEAIYDKTLQKWIGKTGAIIMPDIFSIVTDLVLVTEEQDGTKTRVVTPEQLKNVIRDLNNPATTAADVATNYQGFINQVFDKYYFDTAGTNISSFSELTTYLGVFSTEKFRITGATGLAYDKRSISELKPVMTGAELGAMLYEQMGGKTGGIESYEIVKVTTGIDSLSLTLSINLGTLLGDNAKIKSLINAEKLYVTATFNLGDVLGDGTAQSPYAYGVDLKINVAKNGVSTQMDSATYASMLKIIKFFVADFDIQKQMDELGVILYDQMSSLNNSIGGKTGVKYFEFTNEGLELVDFYTFLALHMNSELLDKYTPEEIKATLQGMYECDTVGNTNNFVKNEIILNAPNPTNVSGHNATWTDSACTTFTVSGGTSDDVDFNGYFRNVFSSVAGITVEQTAILAFGDVGTKATTMRNWINTKLVQDGSALSNIDKTKGYLVLTFSMSMKDYLNAANDCAASGLLPDKIYATLVFQQIPTGETGAGGFTQYGGIIFNNLSQAQYAILSGLMSDSTGSNPGINSVATNSKTALDNMITFVTVTLTKSIDKGIGKITSTPKIVIGS